MELELDGEFGLLLNPKQTILPRVGIVQPYAKRTEEKGVDRTLAAYSLHSLRHSLSMWLNNAGH